jgi:hypothetical protein
MTKPAAQTFATRNIGLWPEADELDDAVTDIATFRIICGFGVTSIRVKRAVTRGA